jgi:hypothetical protein
MWVVPILAFSFSSVEKKFENHPVPLEFGNAVSEGAWDPQSEDILLLCEGPGCLCPFIHHIVGRK